MTGLALLLASLMTAPAAAEGRRFNVPMGKLPVEAPVPEFRKDPSRRDLQAVVKHLGRCITAPTPAQDGMATIDQFLNELEAALQRGNDVPRDRILRNAEQARETLRRAYNDLAAATAPQFLQESRDNLKGIVEGLPPVLEKNRASVERLGSVEESARATVSAMVLAPPESPGAPVPLSQLDAIETVRPDLLELREKLRTALKSLKKAKAFVARAKERAEKVDGFAETAAKLDDDALSRLNERRTRGVTAQYRTQMLSREVILNANKWLKKSIEKSEAVVKLMEEQVDPKKPGVRMAYDKALEADRRTLDSKELVTRSGNRINFNHKMRLNDVIRYGWESATDQRRAWWVGRARMARDEGVDDVGKMDDARREADDAALEAERAAKEAAEKVRLIDEAVGRSEEAAPRLDEKFVDVPAPKVEEGERTANRPKVDSKPIKIPHTLEVSDAEILGSYDSNGR